jgi:hypothetical protein
MAGNPALMSMCLEALANATGLMEEDGEEDKRTSGLKLIIFPYL